MPLKKFVPHWHFVCKSFAATMAELSSRRVFLYLLGITCFLVLSLYTYQQALWNLKRLNENTLPVGSRSHISANVSNGFNETISRQLSEADDEDVNTKKKDDIEKGQVEAICGNVTAINVNKILEDGTLEEEKYRPWYMSGGTRRPLPAVKSRKSGRRMALLWPEEDPGSDRITNQLMFVPPSPSASQSNGQRLKKILMYFGLGKWAPLTPGRDMFREARCPVDTCTITLDQKQTADADAILYHDRFAHPGHPRPPKQVWILYHLESPYHTYPVEPKDVFNWTATYRRDSDIRAPYFRWVYYDERVKQNNKLDHNYAANKTKKVAWFVSNCNDRNGRRQYAYELQKHIPVDIYGACGTKKCPRSTANKCFDLLDTDYKFYLAFENSNCKDYITEKLFHNALSHNILPIVMGARPEEYALVAPYRSYIHVDEFESPEELAAYLHLLDNDDDLYNSYFRWKGTGELISHEFLCRLCAVLHDDFPNKFYRDVNDWWRGPGICTGGSWRDVDKILKRVPEM